MPKREHHLRMALVGGGPGAFIGPVHRMAAELDGDIQLVAGAFSQDSAKSIAAGQSYGLDAERVYPTYQSMIERERSLPSSARIDFVAIVTPNHLHYPIARHALEAGFHVLSDKPATATLEEALSLQDIVKRSGRLYGLTYTYTGYPLVREARDICRRGDLGSVRKVVAEYSQGWLSERLETNGSKQATWRTDPAQAGIGGCIGDIGVHAFNLVEFVTGHRVVQLCADVSTVVEGRSLDDDCNVLLRLDNDARGVLHASQIAAGERNGLRLRVYGEKGSLDWSQEDPNRLRLHWLHQPDQIIHGAANVTYLSEPSRAMFRLPAGHPEGYIEAFANLYREFAVAMKAMKTGQAARPPLMLVPSIDEGVRSMSFVKLAVESSRNRTGWVRLL
jgi:predicted dehydrogenase